MRTLDVSNELGVEIKKKLFRFQPASNDGFVLNVIHSSSKRTSRFVHCDFHSNGNILALANKDSEIFMLDFFMKKIWKLKKFDSCPCSTIKLSKANDGQILIGKYSGTIEIVNIDTGQLIAKLIGHVVPVQCISFTRNNTCMSSSKHEAIIWDLASYSKLQILSLQADCSLKSVLFVPISNHIVVCYEDDIMQIWKHGNFKHLKQFHPSSWRNYSLRSISFTSNGKVMAVGGYLPVIAFFQLHTWKIVKIINLPQRINTVKKIQFMPQHFDGGCNKILAILAGNGILYFFNVEENYLISELKTNFEINNFYMASENVQYISCLLCTGTVEVYDAHFYTGESECPFTHVEVAQDIGEKKTKFKNYYRKVNVSSKTEIETLFEIDKLKSIVLEYQEFPEAFRATIWEKILKLPNNRHQYNTLVNHVYYGVFEDLSDRFPLNDKTHIECLKHLLNNIVSWCPFFADVDYLPCFVFPFMKVFHKKPIACFELCCTIIVNWCQHWFEYHPLPPLNILAIIDNLLIEHVPSLLQYLSNFDMKPLYYSWPVLESAFSEVLSSNDWLKFWDHVFINEPSFLICAVVAFLMIVEKYIISLNSLDELRAYFGTPKPFLDVNKLIKKTYYILNNTSDVNHPRQYLNMYVSLENDNYPVFDSYPKEVVDFQLEHSNYLESQLKETNKLNDGMLNEQKRREVFKVEALKNEEERRMIEVEKACIKKVRDYQDNLICQQKELKVLKQELLDQENEFFKKSSNMQKIQTNLERSEKFNVLADGLVLNGKNNEAKINLASPRKANVAMTLVAMDNLIDRIKSELQKDVSNFDNLKDNLKIDILEQETKDLQKQISQLKTFINQKGACTTERRKQDFSANSKTVRFT